MCNSSDQDLSNGKLLKRICNFVLERASSSACEPLIGALRCVFVPTIDQRVFGLLGQAFTDSCCCEPDRPCQSCDYSGLWVELIEELNRILAREALGRAVRDAVLLTGRIDRIGCELDRLGLEAPGLEVCAASARECQGNLDQLSGRCLSTSNENCQTKPSRKRKACCMELPPEPIQQCAISPSPACPRNVPLKGTSRCTTRCQTDVDTSHCNPTAKCLKRTDKMRLVVENICSDSPSNTKCRRNEYVSLPLQTEALEEKVFEDSAKKSLKCWKLNDRFKNVCSCINSVANRMSEDQISQTSLSCDVRKNYVRFKLGRTNGKECKFATRVPIQDASCQIQPRRKINCPTSERPSCGKVDKACCARVVTNEPTNSCRTAEDHNDCSTIRFLWNNQGDSFDTVSSYSDSSVFSSEQISSFNCDVTAKESKAKLNCESRSRKMISLSEYKKCFQELDQSNCKATSKCNSPKAISVKIASSSKSSKYQEVQAMVEKTTEGRCFTRKVSSSDKQTCTDVIDDTIELTNIYINEISFCYCDEEPAREIGINTESCQCSVSVDISTNTERINILESSTQAILKDCRCDRRVSAECEIRSFKFEDADFDAGCKCDMGTATEAKCSMPIDIPKNLPCQRAAALDLAMQSWSSAFSDQSQFTNVIRSKIGEIIDLNRRIREKMSCMRETKELCSVSVQTLSRPGDRNLVQVKLKTSLLAVEPNENSHPKKLTSCKSAATEMRGRRFTKRGRVCNDRMCRYRNSLDQRSLTRSSSTFEGIPRCRPAVQESASLDLVVSSSFCSVVGNFDRGDFEEMYLLNYPRRRRDERRSSRCFKKSNFLNYVSEHLTRETFERCKKLLRAVLDKFLEGARRLGEYRRRGSRCRCCECRCAEGVAGLRSSCEDSCSSRLRAGADARECSTRPASAYDRDLGRAKSRAAKYTGRPEAATDRADDKAARVRSCTRNYPKRPEGRKGRRDKRLPVAPPWKKPYDIYEASSGSMPLPDTWK